MIKLPLQEGNFLNTKLAFFFFTFMQTQISFFEVFNHLYLTEHKEITAS